MGRSVPRVGRWSRGRHLVLGSVFVTPPRTRAPRATVLALHHGYRTAGGEERAAGQLADLAEDRLGEQVAWLRRDSTRLTAGDAARGLIAGGTGARQVTDALAETGADLVHAHNLFPTFGPAALRAARENGAAVVVHLHNYRLVCAVATNVRDGRDCTECRRGWSVPGLVHRCRGSVPESAAYAAALPRWQRNVVDLADVVVVPSLAARARLVSLGLRLRADRVHVIGGVAVNLREHSTASKGRYALLVTRLAPEKEVRTAIDACELAGVPLVIAGDGPERDGFLDYAGPPQPADSGRAAARAQLADILGEEILASLDSPPELRGSTVFVGRVGDHTLATLRSGARIGLAPSVAHETFGLSALESMCAALPTVGSSVGALPELIGEAHTVPPGDARLLADQITRMAGSDAEGLAAAERARRLAAPEAVAERLRIAYAAAREQLAIRRSYR